MLKRDLILAHNQKLKDAKWELLEARIIKILLAGSILYIFGLIINLVIRTWK